MLTGDGQRTALAVSSRLGIERFVADALPDDKAEFVRELQMQGKKVAMVGDGINDSQALALADVSHCHGKRNGYCYGRGYGDFDDIGLVATS